MRLHDLPWQELIAALMGVAALVHMARSWWPKGKDKGAAASGCGSCDSGCGSKDTGNRQVCDHPTDMGQGQPHGAQGSYLHRMIPITQETPST